MKAKWLKKAFFILQAIISLLLTHPYHYEREWQKIKQRYQQIK